MKCTIGFVVLSLVLGVARAGAQDGGAFGIGPRVTFQRGSQSLPDSSALRVFGGQIKLRLSPGTAIEVSADYDTTGNESPSLTQRAKTMPIQASLLLFPVRSTLSPYVLGGVGWYRHSLTEATPASSTPTTTSVREMGYHAGLGAELRVGRRMAVHGDYRYNHIRFGGDGDDSTRTSSIPGLSAVQESLKMSHNGSMWNWGVTFFF